MAKQYGLNEAVDFAAANLVSFGGSFTRLNGQPIDKSQLWYPIWEEVEADGVTSKVYKTGLERAQAYAATNAAFVGQELAVILPAYNAYADAPTNTIPAEGATVTGTTVTFYGIQDAAGTLKELGSEVLVDNLSIVLNDEGKLEVYAFADASEGTVAMKEDGKIVWKTLEEIGAGDGNTVTTISAEDLSLDIALAKNDDAEKAYRAKINISEIEGNALSLAEDGLYVEPIPDIKITKDIEAEVPTDLTVDVLKHISAAGHNITEESVQVVTKAGLDKAIGDLPDYTVTVETDDPEDTSLKHYVFYQKGVSNDPIAHIDIPKDLVVESGSVITATVEDVTDTNGVVIGETYIKLVIANQEEPIYIAAKDLVEIYKVDNTDKTVELTVAEDGVTLSADVKISAEGGNSLVAKDDGLYVNAPTLPTVEDEKEAGQVVVAVSQTDGKIAVTREKLSYNDLTDKPEIPTIPKLVLGEAEELDAATDATIAVIAQLGVNEHTITPKTIEVASKKGLEDLAAIVGVPADDKGAVASGVFAEIAALGLELDNATTADKLSYTYVDGQWSAATKTPVDIATILVEANVVKDTEGNPISGTAGLMTPAEKYKLSALEIGDSGNIEISGSVNADNVVGLDAKVIGIVTGEADGQLAIQPGAQVNLIEHLAIQTGADTTDYLDLNITDKRVVLPLATTTSIGLVQSATGNNQVSYANGVGTVAHVSTDTLVQGTNELILNGGTATGAATTA